MRSLRTLKQFAGGTLLALALLPGAARAQSHSVTLRWSASTDSVTGYNVYRLGGACPASGTASFAKLTATPLTAVTFTDTAMQPGAYCYYATSTVNGAESPASNFVAAVILPAAPTGLSVSGTI